jgi:hypothetical protein
MTMRTEEEKLAYGVSFIEYEAVTVVIQVFCKCGENLENNEMCEARADPEQLIDGSVHQTWACSDCGRNFLIGSVCADYVTAS